MLDSVVDRRSVRPLIEALKDENSFVREQAVELLGKIKATGAVQPLIAALKDQESNVRKTAAWALVEINENDPRIVKALTSALMNRKLEIVAFAHTFFIRLGKSGSEAILIEALEMHGYKLMAENFLNCGNSQLDKAARNWAKKHGFEIQYSPIGRGPKWGGMSR